MLQSSTITTVTFASTITLDGAVISNQLDLTLAGNITLANPVNFVGAATLNMWVTQPATGTCFVISALGSQFKTASGTGLVLSTTLGAIDLISLVRNPTKNIWAATIMKAVG